LILQELGRIRQWHLVTEAAKPPYTGRHPEARPYAILDFMQSPLQSPTAASDPKSVKVNLTTGTGVDIEWNDGHVSHYNFVYLRDACPCAMCNEERDKAGRHPGDAPKLAPGTLPMFKAAAKPVSAEGVGKYAIKFSWNDSHDLGIYSWKFLREICPCAECKASSK
jgi:DUF971 family protein